MYTRWKGLEKTYPTIPYLYRFGWKIPLNYDILRKSTFFIKGLSQKKIRFTWKFAQSKFEVFLTQCKKFELISLSLSHFTAFLNLALKLKIKKE
jgi:hypothetical protein